MLHTWQHKDRQPAGLVAKGQPAMTFAILAACCVAGWYISRPVVRVLRAFGIVR